MMVEMENWPDGAADDGLNELDLGGGVKKSSQHTCEST